jgi:hypothetical protein
MPRDPSKTYPCYGDHNWLKTGRCQWCNAINPQSVSRQDLDSLRTLHNTLVENKHMVNRCKQLESDNEVLRKQTRMSVEDFDEKQLRDHITSCFSELARRIVYKTIDSATSTFLVEHTHTLLDTCECFLLIPALKKQKLEQGKAVKPCLGQCCFCVWMDSSVAAPLCARNADHHNEMCACVDHLHLCGTRTRNGVSMCLRQVGHSGSCSQ